MKKTYYPRLDETVCRKVLPNGLTVMVVPKPGFSRKIAYFMTNYGSIHTAFTLDGVRHTTPPVSPTISSTRCSTCLTGT